MIQQRLFSFAVAMLSILGLASGLAACGGEPVGRLCDLGLPAGEEPLPSARIVASGSLDCLTRTCLKVPLEKDLPEGSSYPQDSGLCTATCESSDECERVPESPCVTGFTCAVATVVGDFCCRKVCVCKDYIQLPESGEPALPAACDPDNAANTCKNLPGR